MAKRQRLGDHQLSLGNLLFGMKLWKNTINCGRLWFPDIEFFNDNNNQPLNDKCGPIYITARKLHYVSKLCM